MMDNSIHNLYSRIGRSLLIACSALLLVALAFGFMTMVNWKDSVDTHASLVMQEFESRVQEVKLALEQSPGRLAGMHSRLHVDASGKILSSQPKHLTGMTIAHTALFTKLRRLQSDGVHVGLYPDLSDRVRRVFVGCRSADGIDIVSFDERFLSLRDEGISVMLLDQEHLVQADSANQVTGDVLPPQTWRRHGWSMLVEARRPMSMAAGLQVVVWRDVTNSLLLSLSIVLGAAVVVLLPIWHMRQLGHGLGELAAEQGQVVDVVAGLSGIDDLDAGDDVSQLKRLSEDLKQRLDALAAMPIRFRETGEFVQTMDGLGRTWQKLFAAIAETQEELRHSHKMDAIGQLAGGVAHDFNNMLAGILGYCEILTMREDLGDQMRHALERIATTAGRAATLTKQLLAFSRKGAVVKERIDARELVEETVELLRRTIDRRIEISISYDTMESGLSGDASLIQNALLNLGVNARDAMPDGGQLVYRLHVQTVAGPRVCTAGLPMSPGEYLIIDVEDDGAGMDTEILEHIFDPFFTTKELHRGTGLGLSAVYGTMKEHGGGILLRSALGSGSCFSLCFPLHRFDTEETRDDHRPPRGQGRLLVVDDEDVVRQSTADLLAALGYQVCQAADGLSALDCMDSEGDIELILVDMVMPKMNGPSFISEARQRGYKQPVIVMTGYADDSSLKRLEKLQVEHVLRKPFRLEELAKHVDSALA